MFKSLQVSIFLGLLSFPLLAQDKPPPKKPNATHVHEHEQGQAQGQKPGHRPHTEAPVQEAPAAPESAPPSTHAASPFGHPNRPTTPAAPPSTHNAPPTSPAAPPSTHAAPPTTPAAPPSTHAAPPTTPAEPPSTHAAPATTTPVAPPSTHAAPPAAPVAPPSTHAAQPSAPVSPTIQRPAPKIDERDIGNPNSRVRIPQRIVDQAKAAKPNSKAFIPPVFQRDKKPTAQGQRPSAPVPKQIPKAVHAERVNFAKTRIDAVMRTNPQVTQVVNRQTTRWVSTQRPIIERRAPVFRQYFNNYQSWRSRYPNFQSQWWYRNRFYGGFYYGFNPVFNINIYFYNPLVYWFFAPTYEVQYYHTWYGDDIDAYPDFQQPFRYNGLFYPTENLRQLLFAVSAMPLDDQRDFRQAIGYFTKTLAQRVANVTRRPAHLSSGDIVITHYAILNYDDGVSIDGFVNQNGRAFSFKGIIDLWNPNTSDVFVATSMDMQPSAYELGRLSQINQRISASGGAVVPDDEPPPPEQFDEGDFTAEPDDEN